MGALPSLGLLLLVPAVPLPAPAPTPAAEAKFDRNQALRFAGRVVQLAYEVQDQYVRPVEAKDLLEASLRGLYEEVGTVCPEDVLLTVRRARSSSDLTEAVAEARVALGNPVALQGPRALFAAVNGFRYATDANTGLMSPRITQYASVDMDCGIGLELDGVSGPRWTLYQLELGYSTGRFPADDAIGPVAKPTPPVSFPWRVKRIVPGSPCQRAGMRPGDVITHFDGKAITAESSAALFRDLANNQIVYDPQANQANRVKRTFRVRRDGVKDPAAMTVPVEPYAPGTVFGVQRVSQDVWDHVLDREYRIGYLRLGSIESGTDLRMSEVIAGLEKKGCRALILDLRWCPGGFVDPGCRTAGLFLDEGALITRMTDRSAARGGAPPDHKVMTPAGWAKYADKPLVVLVGPETSGGGEMIAAALQDHNRALVIGQRTLGKGNVQRPFTTHIGDLQFKVSTGYSLRPNGKNRHRFPDSKPTDDWGVRPDVGFEVPMTADALADLRRAAELHSLRPADSREALAFDDPDRDPHRLFALKYLRKKLGPPAEEKKQ